MKDFYTLSMNELISLDQDTFEDFVDAEALKTGIKVVAAPVDPKPVRHVPCDLHLIEVENLVVNAELGREIQALLQKYGFYKRQWNNNAYSYDKSLSDADYYAPKFRAISVRSEVNQKEYEIACAPATAHAEQNKEQQEAYDAYINTRSNLAVEMRKRITEAWRSYYDIQSVLEAYNKALKVADNDETLAKKIFVGYGGDLDSLDNALKVAA